MPTLYAIRGFRVGFALRSPPYKGTKGKRNADRRVVQPLRAFGAAAHPAGCARLSAFHQRRFPGASERSRPASGHASWDAAATISSLSGRYPPLPVPVQCAPHGRPRLPAADAQSRPGAACNSARGHRPRSRTAMCLRGPVLSLSENHGADRNINGDKCQYNGDKHLDSDWIEMHNLDVIECLRDGGGILHGEKGNRR